MSQIVLRLDDVKKITGLSRSTIYDLQKIGDFPPAIKLSERSVGWLQNEVTDWLQQRIERRNKLNKRPA